MPMNFQPWASSFGSLSKITVGFGGLSRIVLDLLDLGDLGQFGDVERAVLERDAVRTIEAGRQHLDLALAVLVDDRIDLVDEAAADEHRALVANRERARIRHARGIDLDVEAGRNLELRRRQFVRRGRNRRRRDRRELGGGLVARGTSDQGGPRRKRGRGCRSCACGRRRGGLLGSGGQCERTEECTGQQQAARRRRTTYHWLSPSRKPLSARPPT